MNDQHPKERTMLPYGFPSGEFWEHYQHVYGVQIGKYRFLPTHIPTFRAS